MDSIERMRRMNELTKELKRHGFAESSFEAIQQVNQIYGDDSLSSEVQHGIIKNSPSESIANKNNQETNTSIRDIERKINKINENIEILTNKINEIVKAINDIDERINILKNRPPERVVERVIEKPVQKRESKDNENNDLEKQESKKDTEHNATHHEKPKDEYSMNQRVGNYQSEDVAIDKMFYFGKK